MKSGDRKTRQKNGAMTNTAIVEVVVVSHFKKMEEESAKKKVFVFVCGVYLPA